MADLISRVYSSFRGVDFRGEEINLLRSPDALNVWKDYKETESIRTRPALSRNFGHTDMIPGGRVNGIYFYKDAVLIHDETGLIEYKKGVIATEIYHSENDTTSCGFIYNDIFYFINGKKYLQYDGTEVKEVVGYIPTTTIGRKPNGGGTVHEDVNMLSDYRKNSFVGSKKINDTDAPSSGLGSGESVTKEYSTVYKLDAQNIDDDYFPEVKVDGEVISSETYTVDYEKGEITFTGEPPKEPETDGQDNVVIKFKKAVPKYRDFIHKCTMVQMFDNRVFYSGNPEYPSMVRHCSLNDPSYISDLDYYKEGMDGAAVKGMVAGNNALWVFREPSDDNATVFYHTPSMDDEYGKIYPSAHSSVAIGCIGKAVNFNDDIVFFSERGMEGISGDITTEQMAAHRSSLVDRKMIAEADYKNMQIAEWEGYLLVFIGNRVYLADSRAMFTNENHYEYEWFMWQFDEYNEVVCTAVKDGVLYLGTDNGLFALNDTTADIESYWVTPLDKFGYPNKLKTTNKRGCVAEATTGVAPDYEGEITVYAKLEDTDFEMIGTYQNVSDYFVCRIKRKKFKDIQLKFYSNTRFSLETVTLECFIGGYIKR